MFDIISADEDAASCPECGFNIVWTKYRSFICECGWKQYDKDLIRARTNAMGIHLVDKARDLGLSDDIVEWADVKGPQLKGLRLKKAQQLLEVLAKRKIRERIHGDGAKPPEDTKDGDHPHAERKAVA